MSDKNTRKSKGTARGYGAGYVYVASNPLMPGLVKVGRTEGLVKYRLRGLYTTGVPRPFQAESIRFFADCYQAERLMHEAIAKVGSRCLNREFFVIAKNIAVDALEDLFMSQHERTEIFFFEWHLEEAFLEFLSIGNLTSIEDTFGAIFGLPHERQEALKRRFLACAMKQNQELVAKLLVSKWGIKPELPIRNPVKGIEIPMYDLTAFEYSILLDLTVLESSLVRIGCDIRKSNALCLAIDVLINGHHWIDNMRIARFAIKLIDRGANVHQRLNLSIFSEAMKKTQGDPGSQYDAFPRSSNMSCYEISSHLAPKNNWFAMIYNAMINCA